MTTAEERAQLAELTDDDLTDLIRAYQDALDGLAEERRRISQRMTAVKAERARRAATPRGNAAFTAADIRAVNAGARRVYCPRCERGHEGPCRANRRRA